MKFRILITSLLLAFIPLSVIVTKNEALYSQDGQVRAQDEVTVTATGDEEMSIASESETEDLSNPFDLEISLDTQSPWNKSLPIIIKIRPNIDTTRTNVTWDVPLGIEIKDSHSKDYLAIPSGETYSYTVTLKPIQSGTYTISATATDWGYGENVASTVSKSITFGDNLVTSPQTINYTTSVGIMYAIIILGILALGIVGYFVGRKALGSLKEWLKPPEL